MNSQPVNLTDFLDDQFIPYFQPIINVINGCIMGYEILGRYTLPGQSERLSLGQHFHSPDIDFLKIQKIDRIIKEKAIEQVIASGLVTHLFINTLPNSLSLIQRENVLGIQKHQILHIAEKYNLAKDKIVIEITEDEFAADIEELIHITNDLRNQGFKIAIDDLGVGFSNLERIGYLHPDIIKVDIKIMRESLNKNSFKQVLTAISEMSQKLGSELLFEGIETEDELNLALSMGANLLQGYYFSKPMDIFHDKHVFKPQLTEVLEKFGGLRFLEILENVQKQQTIINSLTQLFSGLIKEEDESAISSLEKLLPHLPHLIYEVIICDLFGYQVSPTYMRFGLKQWKKVLSDTGNNYAWKPFFFKHKAEGLHFQQKWGVTDPHFDMKNKKQYVIFTFSIKENLILIAKVDWESDLI